MTDNKQDIKTEVSVDFPEKTEEKVPTDKKEAAPLPKPGVSDDAIVWFNKDIVIYPGKRMSYYDNGPVKAFAASDKEKGGQSYVALVCEPHLTPRMKSKGVYSSIINPCLVTMVGVNVVYWTPEKQQRMVFIYRDMLGKRLMEPNTKKALHIKEDIVLNKILPPMIGLLEDLRNKDFVHGSIRPTNIFDGGTGDKLDKVVLGDCLSMPPSYMQPALFEPVERAMAHPVGRGRGTPADDLYSFGVTLAVMLRSNDPLEGMDDRAMLQKKIESGTYSSVIGKDRFKGAVLELLRGLLIDDASQRWTIDEILIWMSGRRLSPKQAVKSKKAQRPLEFLGKKYMQGRILAMDIDLKPQETMTMVDSGDLELWVERALQDEEASGRLEGGIRHARERGTGPGYDQRLVANVSSALDPDAPIRYKGLKVHGEGIGYSMVHDAMMNQSMQPYLDIFVTNIAMNWLSIQDSSNLDIGSMISRFEMCRSFSMQNNKVGQGWERCAYLLNPEAQCLSEKLKNYWVRNPEDLMYAFEDLCQKGKAPSLFLDRHIVAFLMVREPKVVENFIFDITAPKGYRNVMGNLKCLASIQKRSNLPGFPAVGQAFINVLGPVFERFHDRRVREDLKKKAAEAATKGDLNEIVKLLDDPELAYKDFQTFQKAMKEFHSLKDEQHRLEVELANKKTFGQSAGRDMAAIASCCIAMVIVLFTAVVFFSDKSFF